MSKTLADIEESTLKLTADEREKLAMKLFESVHNQELNDIDLKWLEIAETRFNDYRSGKDSGISENNFFSRVQESLGWK